jgi:gliding motility-associated-like protein
MLGLNINFKNKLNLNILTMKKVNYVLGIILLCQFLSHSLQLSAQNSIVIDGAYIVLDGGVAGNNINIVIDQPNPLGILRLPSGGHIHSENQYNVVKWLTGASTGSYIVPFGVGGNATDYIPFTFDKTAGNSSVSMATWATSVQNVPKPLATNVGAVTNMPGITDSVIFAIDRFWDIQAPATTADLTFSYRGIENTTASPTNLIQTQHWNGTTWDAPVGPGNAGVATGIGTAGPFIGQNTFSPWVLISTCTVDTLTQNPIVCQGSSVTVGANIYTSTGAFIDTLTNIQGCDSIITTNLTVNPTITGTDVITSCVPITWIDGINYAASTNTPTFTIVGGSSSGCDSIVTLDLTISNGVTGTDVITSCVPITWIDGINYAASTNTPTFTIVGGSSSGCDSIVTLDLTISNGVTGTDIQTTCEDFTWIDGITYTASTNTPTFTIVGGSSAGCDSILTLDLTINSSSTTTNIFVECEGFSTTVGSNIYNSTGVYTDVLNGCDTIITDLTINPSPTLALIKFDDNCGEEKGSVEAIANSNNPPITYTWNTGSSDSIINNLQSGTYTVIVSDGSGCSITDSINIFNLEIDCDYFVYLPNAFTPNGDQNNDILYVRGKGITSFTLNIYNRWGNKVFETDELNTGWDGTYKAEPQNTAVFVYTIEGVFENGETFKESGDISLLR